MGKDDITYEPEDTGITPSQTEGSVCTVAAELMPIPRNVTGIGSYSLSDTLKEISDNGLRGNASMQLLCNSVMLLEEDLKDEKNERKKALTKLEEWRDKYYKISEECSVLKNDIKHISKLNPIKNILSSVGGLFTGLGLKQIVEGKTGASFAFLILGIGLMLLSWFFPQIPKEGK